MTASHPAEAKARAAKAERIARTLTRHYGLLGVLDPELIANLLEHLDEAGWAHAAARTGDRPPSADTQVQVHQWFAAQAAAQPTAEDVTEGRRLLGAM